MGIPLNVLILDDNDDDAQLMVAELEAGGYDLAYQQLCDADRMRHWLDQHPWDIILSDYSMGQFTGLDALHLMQEKRLDVPFIVISGTIGEDVAVQAMRAGANDYLMKGNLARLVPAVRRELAEARNRREKRRAEQEKQKLLQVLEQRNAELQSIVYISSHDLRSPLVNIQGFSAELEQACGEIRTLFETVAPDVQSRVNHLINDDIHTSLDFIRDNADKMCRLVDGLLRFSEIGSRVTQKLMVDVDPLVRSILDAMAPQIRRCDASITCAALPRCLGDEAALREVFTVLLDNAIKYRHPDRPPQIHITADCGESLCTIYVRDNGIGIDPRFRGKIFDIFHRLRPLEAPEGIGLGLTMAKSLLLAMDAGITFESQVGQGSTFIVTLPRSLTLAQA